MMPSSFLMLKRLRDAGLDAACADLSACVSEVDVADTCVAYCETLDQNSAQLSMVKVASDAAPWPCNYIKMEV